MSGVFLRKLQIIIQYKKGQKFIKTYIVSSNNNIGINGNGVQSGFFQPNVDQNYRQKEGSPTGDSGFGSETKNSLTRSPGKDG